jgi:transcriptional antiterminator
MKTNPLIHGYLNEKTISVCEKAIEKVKEVRLSTSRSVSPVELFQASEYLQSFRAWITNDLLEADAKYRDKISNNRMSGMSVSGAESEARISPEYRAYKYLERIDMLADEQIKLVKKFFTRSSEEYGSGY